MYEYKIKKLIYCSSCKAPSLVYQVEKISLCHSDDNEIIKLCLDCLTDLEDREKEKGE